MAFNQKLTMNRSTHLKTLTVEEVTDLMRETWERMSALGHDAMGEPPTDDAAIAARGDYGVLRCATCHRVAFVEMAPSTDRGYAWGGALDDGRCPGHKVRSPNKTFGALR